MLSFGTGNMEMEEMRTTLGGRIHTVDIALWNVRMAQPDGQALRETFFRLLSDEDKRVSDNAAWVLSHARGVCRGYLADRQSDLIDMVMAAATATFRRLLLSILLKQTFRKETLRVDFIDFCMQGMADSRQSVGVRALCLYLSWAQCRHYPELVDELRMMIGMLDGETMTSGLRCAKRRVLAEMDKVKEK
jgi:hypothetical protein